MADGEEKSLEEIRGGMEQGADGAVEGQCRGTVSDQHTAFIIWVCAQKDSLKCALVEDFPPVF